MFRPYILLHWSKSHMHAGWFWLCVTLYNLYMLFIDLSIHFRAWNINKHTHIDTIIYRWCGYIYRYFGDKPTFISNKLNFKSAFFIYFCRIVCQLALFRCVCALFVSFQRSVSVCHLIFGFWELFVSHILTYTHNSRLKGFIFHQKKTWWSIYTPKYHNIHRYIHEIPICIRKMSMNTPVKSFFIHLITTNKFARRWGKK